MNTSGATGNAWSRIQNFGDGTSRDKLNITEGTWTRRKRILLDDLDIFSKNENKNWVSVNDLDDTAKCALFIKSCKSFPEFSCPRWRSFQFITFLRQRERNQKRTWTVLFSCFISIINTQSLWHWRPHLRDTSGQPRRDSSTERGRRYLARIKSDPNLYAKYCARKRRDARRRREKKKMDQEPPANNSQYCSPPHEDFAWTGKKTFWVWDIQKLLFHQGIEDVSLKWRS